VHFVVKEIGHGDMYQMSSTKIFMKHSADTRTDDGYQPFSEGAYQLKWKEPNELVINSVIDYMSPDDYNQEVIIKYK